MTAITDAAIRRPRFVLWLAGLLSVFWIVLVAVPSVFDVPTLNGLRIDTDPENMLAEDEPVRAFHNEMMAEFGLYDFIVVGVVEETHPNGVFNAQTLGDVLELARFAETIRWGNESAPEGVIASEILAPNRVDVVEQAGLGAVRFDWWRYEVGQSTRTLVHVPYVTAARARRVAQKPRTHHHDPAGTAVLCVVSRSTDIATARTRKYNVCCYP